MKRIFTIIASIAMLISLASCAKNAPPEVVPAPEVTTKVTIPATTTEATTSVTPAETTMPATTPPAVSTALNLLSGEATLSPEAIGKRPVAVMINNNLSSLPQYGIAAADVIIEAPVEGGITRLMAIYGDYTKVPRVCSVRSARYYFALLANGMDAIYVHWGSDKTIAKETIERIGITKFDGEYFAAPLFSRDAQRLKKGMAKEHTGYLEGANIPAQLEVFGYRSKLKDNVTPLFNFGEATTGATPATTATVKFSGAYYSTFTYKDGSYLKEHSGKPHMDSVAKTQLAFKNVLILKTDITLRNAHNGLMNVELSSGTGSYLTNGTETPIKWSKADDSAPIVFTTLDGAPLTLNSGKTYIAINS